MLFESAYHNDFINNCTSNKNCDFLVFCVIFLENSDLEKKSKFSEPLNQGNDICTLFEDDGKMKKMQKIF